MAIVKGQSLNHTLKDLCIELQIGHQQRQSMQKGFDVDFERQHQRLLDVTTETNELSVLLYTQEQEMTFDLAYALKKVTEQYHAFSSDRRPYDQLVESLNIEIDRYSRLMKALRRLPPKMLETEEDSQEDSLLTDGNPTELQAASTASPLENEVVRLATKDSIPATFSLDAKGQMLRDSCLHMATDLMKLYVDNLATVMTDSTQYEEVWGHLQEIYGYAQYRYGELEKYIFVSGQIPFLEIVSNLHYYWNKTKTDLHGQYGMSDLVAAIDRNGGKKTDKSDTAFYESLTSKAENTLLVFLCAFQLIALALTWLVAFVVIWLACRFTRIRNYVPKKKMSIVSILTGTILYFLVFGFLWHGDEYIEMGVGHVNTFLWLLIAISGSLLLRVKPDQFRQGFQLYSATFLVVLVIIACRITFIPDKLMVLLFPPILLLIVLRQLFFCIRVRGRAMAIDSNLGWASFAIYLASFVFAFLGYTFVALLILVFWYFLLAAWLTLLCVSDLMGRYKQQRLDKRVQALRNSITYVTGEDREALLFGATWFYDLIRQVAIPTIILLSLPLCVRLSLSIFDFDDLYVRFYETPFVHLFDKSGAETLRISAKSIVYLLILYYVLRYFSRALHAIWQYASYMTFMRKHNRTAIRANEINLSLGNSIISVLIWFAYAAVVIVVWQIPTGSLGLVAGGLSAGIGLALKDVINNFIYGIQLMGGRLRVGDWIECEGVRGKVTSINYQCVLAETIEGTEMSFLNSSLFGKNFNNLTRNNSYELTTIVVGVAYGTDVNRVREVLVEAMQKMRTKDHYGREIVDPKKGVYVVVGNMSSSSVDIAVKQYVLVAERIGYVDRAKEVIYEALNAAGITIPFPQCDVHLISEDSQKNE